MEIRSPTAQALAACNASAPGQATVADSRTTSSVLEKANRGPKTRDTFEKIRTPQKTSYFASYEALAVTEPKSLAEQTHQTGEAELVSTHQDGEGVERHL